MQEVRETIAVRAGETLDWLRLAAYIRAHFAESGEPLPHDEMSVVQFPGGHSNLTYLLRFGESEYVMRRPPFGTLPPRAHDMAREYRLLARIHPVFHLAPRPILLCEDASITGATFYLMERRRGLIIRAHEPAPVRAENVRRAISSNLVDALVALHAVDVRAHKLEDLGKPAGFVTRQVKGWAERWHKAQTEEVAEMEHVARWLDANTPLDATAPTLVHGDFKLDNVMLNERDVTRVIGVFDWEMAANGDPLVDLGILLSYWTHAAAAIPSNTSLAGVTHLPGWFTRDEIVERYAVQSGRDVSNIKFYEIFAVFKLAVVAGQIFYRFQRGQTADPRFARFDEYVRALGKRAAALVSV